MSRDNWVALAFVLAALFVMVTSWMTRSSLPISRDLGRQLGELIFIVGLVLFIWAAAQLKEAFRGTIAPVSDRLVQSGPYQWVRHPLYLSMIVMLLGISIALRSILGIIGMFALFTPTMVYRARLEEAALAERFGEEWEIYSDFTHFLIPWLW